MCQIWWARQCRKGKADLFKRKMKLDQIIPKTINGKNSTTYTALAIYVAVSKSIVAQSNIFIILHLLVRVSEP